MLKNPKVGMQCWIITDLWETFCAVPVTIIAENPESGEFVCRWQITEEYSEDYEGRTPEDLYETERAAREAIKKGRF